MIKITLTSLNLGPLATADDFEQWVQYAGPKISGLVDYPITVDSAGFYEGGADRYSEAPDDVVRVLRVTVAGLLTEWKNIKKEA